MSEATLDELFAAAVSGPYEDENEAAWNAVRALRAEGSEEVLQRALALTRSASPLERARAADVLAQLGGPEGKFAQERYSALAALLQEDQDPLALSAAAAAMGHLGDARCVPLLTALKQHPDERVRFDVAFALGHFDAPEAIESLLYLMKDPDAEVRDWATFGVGQSEADSDEIRQALYARIEDPDEDTQAEAMAGLARRKDKRVLPFLRHVMREHPESVEYIPGESVAAFLDLESLPEGWTADDCLKALAAL